MYNKTAAFGDHSCVKEEHVPTPPPTPAAPTNLGFCGKDATAAAQCTTQCLNNTMCDKGSTCFKGISCMNGYCGKSWDDASTCKAKCGSDADCKASEKQTCFAGVTCGDKHPKCATGEAKCLVAHSHCVASGEATKPFDTNGCVCDATFTYNQKTKKCDAPAPPPPSPAVVSYCGKNFLDAGKCKTKCVDDSGCTTAEHCFAGIQCN
jgi:hypothetical protein